MSNKSYKSGLFKRIIDLGVVSEADVDDLVRIWRVATGDEKAITLQNFVQTVNTELGTGGLTLTEIVAIIDAEVAGISGDFVTLTTDQTITGEKNFDAKTILGDSSTDYVLWDKISKVFSIFTQAQFTHKYRGGAAGSLNIGQYDVNGNASVNNTSNGKLLLGTNNTTRVEIGANGDVLLNKVDSGTGETLMIEPSGRVVKGSGGGISIPEGRIPFGDVDGSLTTLAGLNYDTITNSLSVPDILSAKKILLGYQVGGNISGSSLPSIQSENSTFTLVGNTTFNPQNFLSNANYRILLNQDAIGLRIITWPSSFLWEDGITPSLSTAANAVDLLIINVVNSEKYCRLYKNFQ